MFGVVPKQIWNKTNPADENNLCTWAMRCLLIEDGNRLTLIDNGIGEKQDEKFLSHYHLHGDDSLIKSINKAGFSEKEITDMFLTHLHFDHCGGGIKKAGEKPELTFPNAVYWSNADHWEWATNPNSREKASFLKENILPMQESGHLKMIDPHSSQLSQVPFDIFYASGHTDRMMVPRIQYKGYTVCFVADLLAAVAHIPIPYVMGYDTRPLITMAEKERFLNEAADKNYVLFFEHDPVNECATVKRTEKGIRLDRTFKLSELE